MKFVLLMVQSAKVRIAEIDIFGSFFTLATNFVQEKSVMTKAKF